MPLQQAQLCRITKPGNLKVEPVDKCASGSWPTCTSNQLPPWPGAVAPVPVCMPAVLASTPSLQQDSREASGLVGELACHCSRAAFVPSARSWNMRTKMGRGHVCSIRRRAAAFHHAQACCWVQQHTHPWALHSARAARRTVGGGVLGCMAHRAVHSLVCKPTCHACRWCSLLQYLHTQQRGVCMHMTLDAGSAGGQGTACAQWSSSCCVTRQNMR